MAELADLEYVASALGTVVSLAQKSAMQSSLQLLKKSHRFAAVKLFGKIQGNTADYLVAIGIVDGLKKYFFRCAPCLLCTCTMGRAGAPTHSSHKGLGR